MSIYKETKRSHFFEIQKKKVEWALIKKRRCTYVKLFCSRDGKDDLNIFSEAAEEWGGSRQRRGYKSFPNHWARMKQRFV